MNDKKRQFIVVESVKKYKFDKSLEKVPLIVGCDVRYHLYTNGNFVQTVPAPAGADSSFIGKMP